MFAAPAVAAPRVSEPKLPGSRKTEPAARRAFQRACALYEEMAAAMAGVLARLRAGGPGAEPPDKTEIETIKAHQKAILMVLDFEAQLLKTRVGRAAPAGRALDLGAARAEIAGRLDRLLAAGDA